MKLTINELAIAFANGYNIQYFEDEREILHNDCKIVELRQEEMTIANGEYQYDVEFDDVKIILRPLSDIDKDIDFQYTDNYGKIVKYPKKESVLGFLNVAKSDLITYHKILNAIRIPGALGKGYCQYNFKANGQLMLPFNIIQLLFQNHFDVFGLIEKGLAINLNSIK